ncbi:MAG TPA: DUF1385 domain-containing protein [Candidatus Limnocylindrales bacterium]|jgi:uncharacterized protein YqhQ|nr:DUF1385 domain-containing protein [Candidatus Limnocylindrales bacterium]
MPRFSYGGQALIEGVLMRGRDAIAVAMRHPDGTIVWQTEPLDSVLHRNRFARTPFFRGLVVLYETLVIGTRWLMRSGSVAAAAEGVEMGRGAIAMTLGLTIAFAVGLFVLLPLFLAQLTAGVTIGSAQPFLQHVIEGLIRVGIFVIYLGLVSQAPDIRRVFQYHGAEHQTIHALEHEEQLIPARVRAYPTAHPRCGTEFLVVFVIVSIFVFSLLAGQQLFVSILGRLALIPVIASVSYEVLRFGARHRSNPVLRWLFEPGIWLQRITTRQPDDGMVEVAIAALQEALRVNGEEAPQGSLDPVRRPLAQVEAAVAPVIAPPER